MTNLRKKAAAFLLKETDNLELCVHFHNILAGNIVNLPIDKALDLIERCGLAVFEPRAIVVFYLLRHPCDKRQLQLWLKKAGYDLP